VTALLNATNAHVSTFDLNRSLIQVPIGVVW